MSKKMWRRVYDDWKERHPEAKDETRARHVRGCIGKFSYQNFLAAMLTAEQLPKQGGMVCIYFCDICQGNHIGNQHKQRFRFPVEFGELAE